MARVAGVDLPKNKRLDIALRYIYGIGPVFSDAIIKELNLDPAKRVKDLTEAEVSQINNPTLPWRNYVPIVAIILKLITRKSLPAKSLYDRPASAVNCRAASGRITAPADKNVFGVTP